jgi:hypothetical protein
MPLIGPGATSELVPEFHILLHSSYVALIKILLHCRPSNVNIKIPHQSSPPSVNPNLITALLNFLVMQTVGIYLGRPFCLNADSLVI